MAKTIQERLNEVDYSFKDYQPSVKALMFAQFIKEVTGGGEENTTPLIHMKMLDLIFDPNSTRKAIMCFRGAAKSTLSAEYGFLYAACFNEYLGLKDVHVGMYVASSVEKGAKDLRRNIEQRYANSPFLQQMIPNKKFSATDITSKYPMDLSDNDIMDLHNAGRNITDARLEFVNINGEKFCVRLFGVTSGIRGFKEYGLRPTIAVLDDLISDQDARSEAVIKTIEEVVYKAVTFALHPTKNCILWCGTPFNSKDPLYKAIESDAWKSVIFPIAERFPCDLDDFKGAWEDRFTYKSVKTSFDAATAGGNEQAFRQEMMLQIIPEEGLIVPKENIIVIPSETFQQKSKKYYNFYITTDFAYSDKQSADFSVITVWAVNSNHDYIVCDCYLGKTQIDSTLDILFSMCQKYKPLAVGVEVTGQQLGFIKMIYNEQLKRNIFFTITEIRPKKDKFSRFNMFSPIMNQKKVMILSHIMDTPWGKEFRDEISKATIEGFKSKHDDVLDTFSQVAELQTFAPSNPDPQTLYVGSNNRIFMDKKKAHKKNSIIF